MKLAETETKFNIFTGFLFTSMFITALFTVIEVTSNPNKDYNASIFLLSVCSVASFFFTLYFHVKATKEDEAKKC